jgi:hypothetical protein
MLRCPSGKRMGSARMRSRFSSRPPAPTDRA